MFKNEINQNNSYFNNNDYYYNYSQKNERE